MITRQVDEWWCYLLARAWKLMDASCRPLQVFITSHLCVLMINTGLIRTRWGNPMGWLHFRFWEFGASYLVARTAEAEPWCLLKFNNREES